MKSLFFPCLLLLLVFSCDPKGKPRTSDTSNSSPYSEKTACLLSEVSYCTHPQQALDKYLPGWKVVWDAAEIEGNNAFVASDGTTYAIGIRGSLIEFSWAAFQNWIYQDLNVVSLQKWPYTSDSSKARIAEGAYQGFQHLSQLTDTKTGKSLVAFLEAATIPSTPILITGHSLGGNLATVYASWLWQYFRNAGHPRNNMNVITFAAPAAGNEAFADDFDKKFPSSLRFENKNDIVAKFPCSSAVSRLGELFDTSLSASTINVGYKNMSVSLDRAFSMISTALTILQFTNGNATYKQTNGTGTLITIQLSGKNTGHDIGSWFSEAGYQHGVARYAAQLGVPVVECAP